MRKGNRIGILARLATFFGSIFGGTKKPIIADRHLSIPNSGHHPVHRRSKHRRPGKVNPAGTKLNRLAAEGKLGKRWP